MMKNLKPATRAMVERRCPSNVAQRIILRSEAEGVENPDSYAIRAVLNWERDEHRRAQSAARLREEHAEKRARTAAENKWQRESKAFALAILEWLGDINATTFALWILSGLSGSEFATEHGLTQDNLYQRKKRARRAALEHVDAETAEWMRTYGFHRPAARKARA